MIRLGIIGVCGRMGKRILSLCNKDRNIEVVLGLEYKGHPEEGKDIEGIKVVSDVNTVNLCDCLIEFTSPKAVIEHLPYLIKFKKPAVIGTTGLNEDEQNKIKEASKVIPLVFSPNMSIGVNLLFDLVKVSANLLKGYKVSIEEAHHIHKKDAPSGTAKRIAEIINSQREHSIRNEDIKSIREDEITGDHKVVFESEVDKIELFHSAKNRDIFAQGAVSAAKWIIDKESGMYSMKDVISESLD